MPPLWRCFSGFFECTPSAPNRFPGLFEGHAAGGKRKKPPLGWSVGFEAYLRRGLQRPGTHRGFCFFFLCSGKHPSLPGSRSPFKIGGMNRAFFLLSFSGPSMVPFLTPFFWLGGGTPYENRPQKRKKRYQLILTSLLEDLVGSP